MQIRKESANVWEYKVGNNVNIDWVLILTESFIKTGNEVTSI